MNTTVFLFEPAQDRDWSTYFVDEPHEFAERIISAIKSAAEAFRKNKTKNKTTEEYWEILPPQFAKITFQHEGPGATQFTWNQITTDLAEFGLKVGDPIRDNTDGRVGCVIAYDDSKDALNVANGEVIHAFYDFKNKWKKQYRPLTAETRKIEKKVYVDKFSNIN